MIKKNNNGYSLVELIVTLAIFSIMMVSVILIMRTTIVTYRDGLFEAEMQEEAQIVANQVSDLLLDAEKYEGPGTFSYTDSEEVNHSGSKWTFRGVGSQQFEIRYDVDANKLLYWSSASGEQTLAENVSDFSIYDIYTRDSENEDVMDNMGSIKVVIKGRDSSEKREFEAEKQVFFRNNIENAYESPEEGMPDKLDIFDVSHMDPNSGEDEDDPDALDEVTMLRFDSLDLSADYNFVSDISFSVDAAKYFDLVTLDDSLVTKAPSGIEPKHYKIVPKDALNADFSLNSEHLDCYITGTTLELKSAGKDEGGSYVQAEWVKKENRKIKLNFDTVSIDPGTGVISVNYDNGVLAVTENGYPTNILVKGININQALKNNSIVASCSMNVTVKGSSQGTELSNASIFYNPNETASINAPDTYKNALDNTYKDKNVISSNNAVFYVVPDPVSGGLVVTVPNGYAASVASSGKNDTVFKAMTSSDGDCKFNFKLKLGSQEYEQSYNLTYIGTPVDKFTVPTS